MTASTADLAPASPAGASDRPRMADPQPLPTFRVNIMRGGYLLMAVGLALTKWPLFIQGTVAELPVFEGVVAALLGAMSLLAILGLRYPVQMLPLLVFESAWKLIWLAAVAVPHLLTGNDMSAQMSSILSSVSVVVVVIAVTPWDYVRKRYVAAAGEPWRAPRNGDAR